MKLNLLFASSVTLLFGAVLQASIISYGSSLTFGGTNSPDTYADVSTFGTTPVLVDSGAVTIWQQQISTGAGSEWDVFYMKTTSGGPLANNINALWSVVITYTLNEPAYFDAVANQWSVNGTAVSPLTNFGSICCATTSNPVFAGDAYYASGFSTLLSGTQTNWQQIFVSPYNFVSSGGIDPNTANGFAFALHLTSQASAPEPATFWLLGAGLATLAYRRRRS
ncbi:MAG: PEP-CTERM sorting domain-containing protein [Bryobacteraceae bacterium]